MCSVPIIGLVVFGESFFRLWLKALSVEEIHTVAILSILTILPQIFSVYIYPLYSVNTITTKIKLPVLVTIGYGILNVIVVYWLLCLTNLGIYAVAGVSSVLSVLYIFCFVPNYAAYTIDAPRLIFYRPLFRGLLCNIVLIIVFNIIRCVYSIKNWTSFFFICILAACIGYLSIFFILRHEWQDFTVAMTLLLIMITVLIEIYDNLYIRISYPYKDSIKINKYVLNYSKNDLMIYLMKIQPFNSYKKLSYLLRLSGNKNKYIIDLQDADIDKIEKFLNNINFE